MKPANFDSVAVPYDFLARLVYGSTIKDSQIISLNKIKPGSTVLVLGGGTGWLIKEIFNAQSDCVIYYVDSSQKMISLAKRYQHHGPVHFIHGNEDSIPSLDFDVVITNFYLDMFKPETLPMVIEKIIRPLKAEGCWIITDFKDGGKWWQSVLLWMMYKFFGWACDVEGERLPDWAGLLEANQFVSSDRQYFFKEFIESALYSRLLTLEVDLPLPGVTSSPTLLPEGEGRRAF